MPVLTHIHTGRGAPVAWAGVKFAEESSRTKVRRGRRPVRRAPGWNSNPFWFYAGLNFPVPLRYVPIMRESKRPRSTKLAAGNRRGMNANQRTGVRTAKKRAAPTPASEGNDRLLALEVFLISGPVSAKFARKNKTVSRMVEICGGQTLKELHEAIFEAFDREEHHLYEFQLGGKGPMDPKATKYGPPVPISLFSEEEPGEDASRTTVSSLGLKVGDTFGYWFDFGDDWWHQINVVAIDDKVPPGKYPKVAKRVGQSPPQYADLEEK